MSVLDQTNPYVLGQHRKSLSELRQELESARDRTPVDARAERSGRRLLAIVPFDVVLLSSMWCSYRRRRR
ncbi:MAG TPA: hypothetical protein VGN33_13100 [Leifsonia sp.]|jgi:hypothetical protein|nr:hypothetical protein [Leifsonia sp.]